MTDQPPIEPLDALEQQWLSDFDAGQLRSAATPDLLAELRQSARVTKSAINEQQPSQADLIEVDRAIQDLKDCIANNWKDVGSLLLTSSEIIKIKQNTVYLTALLKDIVQDKDQILELGDERRIK
jgi:hypothetical protein